MPSTFAHAVAGLAIGVAFRPLDLPPSRRYWVIGAGAAALPDIDAIGRPFHMGDVAWLGGHRGLTHSMVFAALFSVLPLLWWYRDRRWDSHRLRLSLYVCTAMASHGFLDALTNVGPGVAFFAPFSWRRFTFPWRPIGPPFTPGVRTTVSARLVMGITAEMIWVGLPSLLLAVVATAVRRGTIKARARRSNGVPVT